jgi:hypothetical protein
VVSLVVLAIAALIAGFALSAPALRPEGVGTPEVAVKGLDTNDTPAVGVTTPDGRVDTTELRSER